MKPGMQGSNVCVCMGEGEFRGKRWAEGNRQECKDQETEVGKVLSSLRVCVGNAIVSMRSALIVPKSQKQVLGSESVIITEEGK